MNGQRVLDLGGEWTLRRAGEKVAGPARVPGSVHADLLAAGRIPDPFYRDNEQKQFWIGESDWIYVRRFAVAPELLVRQRVLLVCEGLDTFAVIRLNGKRLGTADNMFRAWEFDVKPHLRPGENVIEARFSSALGRKELEAHPMRSPATATDLPGRNMARKEQCNYGWDWGPKCLTCGIWRPIRIVAFDTARLTDVHVIQDHSRGSSVGLTVKVGAEVLRRSDLGVRISVFHKGRRVVERTAVVSRGQAVARLSMRKPRLWWPNGMGEQNLYEVRVALMDAESAVMDRASRRVGLRRLELVRNKDPWGESFHFAVNGVPFFAKGANWIPADQFQARVTLSRYRHLLQSAAAAHMNFIRVWGGGIYEDDAFYDLCDELGLCVWQDFMFACMGYPTDHAFLSNVRVEAGQNVRRLRHHPSLALWCGNNEIEQCGFVADDSASRPGQSKWCMTLPDYERLFEKLLPDICARLDPGRPYWPSSPHSMDGKRGADNSASGDAHLWSVWHGRQPFEWYRTAFHRFCSEFGFQSFPEPKTVRGYTAAGDRNVTSYVMELHQRSGIGNTAIMQYMLNWFRMPSGFENTLWLSQLQQGLAIKYAAEHWRRHMPRCMGAIYWQLNDTWPVASWSSIDYSGRWKALHYMARAFFAPLLISGLEDGAKGTVELHVTNDRSDEAAGTCRWTLTTAGGRVLMGGKKRVRVGGRRSVRIDTLGLKSWIDKYTERNLLLWFEFRIGARVVSRNFVTFARPKHLELADPRISAEVQSGRHGTFAIRLKATKPALWAWMELSAADAVFSDNWMCLEPGKSVEIAVKPAVTLSRSQFVEQLKVRSLYDTYCE